MNSLRSFFQIALSFCLVAFGLPSFNAVLSSLSAAFGLAIFWNTALSLPRRKFLVAVVWFAGVQSVQLNWLLSFDYMGLGILAVYLFVIAGLGVQFGALTALLRLPMSWTQIFGLSGFWVLMEWSRLFFLTGFSWNPIGLSLAANPYSIQMASLFGIFGLCFWVIFVNLTFLKRASVGAVLAIVPYGYGLIHKSVLEIVLPPGKELSVALVQMALHPEQRDFFPAKAKEYVHPLIQWDLILSQLEKKGKAHFDLIVLSEGAIPNGPWPYIYPYGAVASIWERHFGEASLEDFPKDASNFREGKRVNNAFWLQALSNHFDAEVVAGLDDRVEEKVHNAAFYFVPQKKAVDRYHKQILIPMGEYIPLCEWAWLAGIAAEIFGVEGSFAPGKEVKIFSGSVPMGVFICLEEAYGQFVREIRTKGASLLVNLTNDVWFPETRLPWHHFDHGRLRAVENGVSLVRATNTGVTAAVGCFGETLAILPPSETEAGVLDFSLKTRSYATLYTFMGDVPVLFF